MIECIASNIARQEYEERVRSLAPVYDYDVELKYMAGHWQTKPIGGLFSAIGQRVFSLGKQISVMHKADEDSPLNVSEPSSVLG